MSREEEYLCSQRNWDEIIPKLLRLLRQGRKSNGYYHW